MEKHESNAGDVLVVGGGGAGLMAALAAAGEGARVILLEKGGRPGGCWVDGIGNAWSTSGAGTRLQADAGISDDSERFYADCLKDPRARQDCDPAILAFYCREAGRAVDWLDALGAYARRGRRPRTGMFGEDWPVLRSYYADGGLLPMVLGEVARLGQGGRISIRVGQRVTGLLRTAAGVTGARAVDSGGRESAFAARAVIVCSGGFAARPDLLRRYNHPSARAVTTVALPHATGDGLMMCEVAGAAMVNLDRGSTLGPYPGGLPDPDRPGRELAGVSAHNYPGAIWVDVRGRRLVREDCGRTSPAAREALNRAPEQTLVVVLDRRILEENPGIIPSKPVEWFLERAAEGRLVKTAGTIESLAALAGVDPAGLRATVDGWNSAVAAGRDAEFGRQDLAYRIENPPFYAIPLGVRVVTSCGGPRTDVLQRVLDGTGKPIPGLYAAGEVTGYQGYGTGMFNTGCVVFGRQAGRMAAREALGLPYHSDSDA